MPDQQRIVTLVLVVSLAIINCVSASIDAKREGYPHLEGYLFFGIASVLPHLVGAMLMLTKLTGSAANYWLWSIATILAVLPGLPLWILCAIQPEPRNYISAGQMHIFLIPILHVAYSILVYFATWLIELAAKRETLNSAKSQ